MEKALVILSGGQDSTTALYWAIAPGSRFDGAHCITFDYGQKHALEIESAKKVAEMASRYAAVTHEVIKVGSILHGSSPLTNPAEPLEKYTDAEQMDKVIGDRREKTFVPMRNALFLTIAANRAEVLGIKHIVLGVCQMDNANYDDCRQNFLDATEAYINYALGHDHRGMAWAGAEMDIITGAVRDIMVPMNWIRLHAPLMDLSKAETVKLARATLGAWDALAYTHTSYDGCYPPTDMNHANVLRAKGFEDADLPDPLVLRAWSEGLMRLPETPNYEQYRKLPRGGFANAR